MKKDIFDCYATLLIFSLNDSGVMGSVEIYSRRTQTSDGMRFICPNNNCGSTFIWMKNLLIHLKYECGMQPRFEYLYCGYRSKYKGDIKSNKGSGYWRSYPGSYPLRVKRLIWPNKFPCPNPNCLSVFAWKRNLMSHLRYQCGQQPRRSNLTASTPQHGLFRPRRFILLCRFIRLCVFFFLGPDLHFSIGSKRFPCPNCPSSFGQKPSLTRHLKYECGQEPRFQCPYCEHRSKKTSDVYTHVRRKHINQRVYAIDIHGEHTNNSKTQWF
ncbi:PREDICTED: zinc finger protein 775-like [Dinoponera quadriceps]|uniref:Zinc finger protein 775-like n=1 Tax=Dinoponera quadriceps TaxID=609295 RepID=A0A6P3X8P3_DINQU|nr:PREDICTED: zinc finger protein 775-like [Dinoponera quadriceps]